MHSSLELTVGARGSLLSRAQVVEVQKELTAFFPAVQFSYIWLETKGDKDLATSLRTLDKTDFFTKEIDEMQLRGECRIAIHSAKDLPEPFPEGLAVAALTKGLDPRDVLVLREGQSLFDLPRGARIGTSSARREAALRSLRSDFVCVDIRGTIEKRLQKLDEGEIDGLVAAECALLRLNLMHRNRLFLAGESARLQGQLAVVVRREDREMLDLFACIDSRRDSYENHFVSRDGSYSVCRSGSSSSLPDH